MMKNILEYKGYHTKIEFDSDAQVLRGKIEGINDLVNFQSQDIQQIEAEFQSAVDDYLEFCMEVGKEPDKEYKGTFNARITPKLHKDLAIYASKKGESLNSVVEKAIQSYVNGSSETNIQLQQTIKILSMALETQTVYREDELPISRQSNMLSFNNLKHVKMSYQS